jgi:hypothetical protein
MGALRQSLATLDGLGNVLPLPDSLLVQEADLLDHLHDLALRFGQRIADLLAHHFDVRPGVFQFVPYCLAPRRHIRQFGFTERPHSSEFGNAAAGLDPVVP